jgi:RES domain-containing protein
MQACKKVFTWFVVLFYLCFENEFAYPWNTAMRPHPAFDSIKTTLELVLPGANKFRGILYRACDPIYANTNDLLAGEGSRKVGGRWNPPGDIATVYLSQSVEGAIGESLGVPTHYGFDLAKRLPLTLVAVDAELESVLDFTDAGIRKSLGVTLAALLRCEWRNENAVGDEALPQAIGRAAFQLGVHGIIVPSAVKRTFET